MQPGILARVRVVEREAPAALIVPRRALAQTAAGWAVFVCENGRPVRHAVELGLATDDWMQITSGLLPDQRVLASADLAK